MVSLPIDDRCQFAAEDAGGDSFGKQRRIQLIQKQSFVGLIPGHYSCKKCTEKTQRTRGYFNSHPSVRTGMCSRDRLNWTRYGRCTQSRVMDHAKQQISVWQFAYSILIFSEHLPSYDMGHKVLRRSYRWIYWVLCMYRNKASITNSFISKFHSHSFSHIQVI